MKNYLKSLITKIKDTYYYYKKLSYYTQKQSRFLFIKFVRLIKYIIFEELSYFLKLKPKVMNQLEAHQVIEDAVKYTGKSVFLYKVNPTTFKREKYHCRYDGEFLIMEYAINQEKVNVKVIAKMILLENESDYLPYELFFVLEEFRKQGVNPKD